MISEKISNSLKGSSMIRAMFEEGERLRKIYGADKVYDFSLGNPDVEPPVSVKEALQNLVNSDKEGLHRYMSNAGYYDVREKVANYLNREKSAHLTGDNIVMTCGAAAALNVVLKTILNPGEEVIVFSPYFVEYLHYINNYDGTPVIVPTVKDTFEPDIDAFEKSITKNTKAVIINSPNNPTGVIYSEDTLIKMADVLNSKQEEYGTSILLVADEPYDKIVYDDAKVPSVFKIFKNSVIVNSFSKSLALPGERIGFIAANNKIDDVKTLVDGFILCNRILGFVNAPAIFQKVVADCLDAKVDIEGYKKKRDTLYNHLVSIGFECVKPQGAFYLFPKSPIEDDKEFTKSAAKHNILVVPGSGFGCPGYFRLSYCISLKTIENSLPAFESLAKEFR